MADRPIKTIRIGGISFSIWAVPRENFTDISIKFDGKSYKDKETGKWKTTYHLFKSDLIKLQVAVQEVIHWAFVDNIFKKKETYLFILLFHKN